MRVGSRSRTVAAAPAGRLAMPLLFYICLTLAGDRAEEISTECEHISILMRGIGIDQAAACAACRRPQALRTRLSLSVSDIGFYVSELLADAALVGHDEDHWPLEQVIMQENSEVGGTFLRGPAPRTAMERWALRVLDRL